MHKAQVEEFYAIARRAEQLGPDGLKIAAEIRLNLHACFAELDRALKPLYAMRKHPGHAARSLPPGDRE
jgi:hypothetical protein